MKNILNFSFFLITLVLEAQVGINTETPQAKLHVVGNTQITGSLKLSGNANTAGSPGTINQILVSQGNSAPAVWKNITDFNISRVARVMSQSTAQTSNANNWLTINFNNTSLNNTDFMQAAPNNEIKVNRTGYYEISVYTQLSITTGAPPYGGTGQLFLNKTSPSSSTLLSASLFNAADDATYYLTATGTVYLTAGDTFVFRISHTRNFSVNLSNFYATFLSPS